MEKEIRDVIVYLVIGCDDGNILITSSARRAADTAREYVGYPPSAERSREMAKYIRRHGDDGITNPASGAYARVERWVVN